MEAIYSQARFSLIESGTKTGKTLGCAIWLNEYAWNNPGSKCWWIAPVFKQTVIGFERCKALLPRELIKVNETEMMITLPNGSVIEGRTGDKPDNLFGDAVVRGVIDEASRLKELSWHAIRTTLTQTQGHLRIVGNPKGKKNWFYRLCQSAKDPLADKSQLDYHHLKSIDNPFITENEIELARKLLPRHAFEELYLGIAQDDIAGVFTNIRPCISSTFSQPRDGEPYYMGLDLAKHADFTVISILDQKKRLVYFDRFNQIDWGFQKKKIESITKYYNGAKIVMDSTGIGDPIFDDLKERGLDIEGLKFTNESKKKLIEGLSIAIQERDILFPDIPELISELEMFEYQITPSGNVVYSAPEGYSDDCVISLALANMCIERGMKMTEEDLQSISFPDGEATVVSAMW
jgi:hypothetical protein